VFGIPVAEIGGFRHFAARLGNRFAHLAADHLRHLFAAGAQRATDVTQRRARSATRRCATDDTLFRKGNRRIDLLFAGPGRDDTFHRWSG
jgi:hypothetical protein